MLSMVDCAVVGGLAGGDTKRVDWRRVAGDRDESHESAEGINMVTEVATRNGGDRWGGMSEAARQRNRGRMVLRW